MMLGDIRCRVLGLVPETARHSVFILSHEQYFSHTEEDLDLSEPGIQEAILDYMDGHPKVKALIADNLSCLVKHVREDKGDDWVAKVLPFLLTLRRRRIATVLVHHSGKSGQQRGTSRREDPLDTVIRLDRVPDHDPVQGARSAVAFEKNRSCYGDDVAPIEARLIEDKDGRFTGNWMLTGESNEDRLIQLVQEAGETSVTDAAEELSISKGYVSKIKKRLQDSGALEPGLLLRLAK